MITRRAVGVLASTLLAATAVTGLGTTAGFASPAPAAPAPAVAPAVADPGDAALARESRTHRRTPEVLGYRHLVVIYQENHSLDNLYGSWGRVGKNKVQGLSKADAAHTTQVRQDGTPYACLPQNDVNLTSPPLPGTCTDPGLSKPSAFTNRPFSIDALIEPTDTTCPKPGVSSGTGTLKGTGDPGGCTRDLVHRFYQEKYQIDGGRQDRYVTGSDAVGLTMGTYDTTQLPIYTYLHGQEAPHYVVADRFFQGANGGSFLNHQWLVAGRAPVADPTGPIPDGLTRPAATVLDDQGMPTSYDQYAATRPDVKDGQLTVACPDPTHVEDYAHACGNFAVNTVQPASAPYGKGAAIPLVDDAKYPNIGDRMSAKGVSWAWYSGGWDDAEAGHPGPLFQYHHQPFNYFADYAKGKPGRAHLQDERDFLAAAAVGNLPTVSFVKPYGAENEHPGYASASTGSDHLVDLLKAVMAGPEADDTLVVVTYDEFGGQWDHVPPPGKGSPTRGAYDAFGPGTRIPALVLSARMRRSGVDHTSYDTTSIIRTLERSLHLAPVGIRDTLVADLHKAVRKGRG
ncbi:alkaline phosphatase family protein [Microlunatus flavus]|uniref:Phospholipase C n=1 Tax=Microlunatus flavus TaxID=1036181 RepID=A0A1H9M0K8_9ACTN|nr:alkaline phosphatase family protein [Microlunatus flavus]SER17208.1 phospholipase C [Microlunatus flavus]